MEPDDHVCLCFRVSLRKLRSYIERTRPQVPSQLSDCLGAGTGCRWCVPFLCRLHDQWRRGKRMDLPVAPEAYAARRHSYRSAGVPNAPLSDRLDPASDRAADAAPARPDTPPRDPSEKDGSSRD